MEIVALKEGVFAVDKQKVFTPTSRQDKKPGLIMGINPFLIETADGLTLLDAGLGWMKEGSPQIVRSIEEAGYNAAQVNRVFLSHLHKDHIDGIGFLQDSNLMPHFPYADVYVQEREYEFALTQRHNPSYNFEVLERLVTLPNVHWMTDNEGQISNTLSYQVTGGHSPYHQVCWIKENGETAFYGADNLPQRGYLKPHIAYKSDYDGQKALTLRREWEATAKAENWTVLFYHDVSMPVTKL